MHLAVAQARVVVVVVVARHLLVVEAHHLLSVVVAQLIHRRLEHLVARLAHLVGRLVHLVHLVGRLVHLAGRLVHLVHLVGILAHLAGKLAHLVGRHAHLADLTAVRRAVEVAGRGVGVWEVQKLGRVRLLLLLLEHGAVLIAVPRVVQVKGVRPGAVSVGVHDLVPGWRISLGAGCSFHHVGWESGRRALLKLGHVLREKRFHSPSYD